MVLNFKYALYKKDNNLYIKWQLNKFKLQAIFDTLNWSHWLVEFYAVASQLSVLAVIIWLNSNSSKLKGIHLYIHSATWFLAFGITYCSCFTFLNCSYSCLSSVGFDFTTGKVTWLNIDTLFFKLPNSYSKKPAFLPNTSKRPKASLHTRLGKYSTSFQTLRNQNR